VRTKRKYNLFGIEFGPKVPAFKTERVIVPVYQETDRHKPYYAAVKQENLARIKREGFQPEFGGNGTGVVATPQTVEQFNSQGHIYFFSSEASARNYSQKNMDGDNSIVEFVIPEYQDFTSDLENHFSSSNQSEIHTLRTAQSIPATSIKGVKPCLGGKRK
jgi:hypothetical protein